MEDEEVPCDVAIVGAGAAGLMTAVSALRARPGLRVLLLESRPRPGAKILVSGGGRCNVTNVAVSARDFHGERPVIARVLRRLDVEATRAFFASIGVALKVEPEFGKLFPVDDRARSVLEALLGASDALGARLRSGFRVEEVVREAVANAGGAFVVRSAASVVRARHLVLACGGRSLPKSGSDGGGYALARALGHTVTHTHEALVPLVLDPHPLGALSGVSFPGELRVVAPGGKLEAAVRGPVLVTHFGLSGPAVLDVSRHLTAGGALAAGKRLVLSCLPGQEPDALERAWIDDSRRGGGKTVGSLLDRALPARLARALVAIAGLDAGSPLARLDRVARARLAEAVTRLPLAVAGSRGWNEAEVTAGGVPLAEIDPGTMESRRAPGLHLVGEVLDVDGRIGGFNFQWAWASGFVAGQALAREPRS